MAALPAGLLAACEPGMPMTVSTTPPIDIQGLRAAVERIAVRARPGLLGVGLMNLESGEAYTFNGDRRFPMQSVFKLPLAVAALHEGDQRRLPMDERMTIAADQLSPGHSPVTAAWPARRDYTIRELVEATLVNSDNTAADILMKRIGGPGAVTAWLVDNDVNEIRVDRYERELQPEIYGMPSFRPGWRDPAVFAAERNAVAPARRMAAMRAYLADPRDTATPRAMMGFLQRLDRQDLISPTATRSLVQWMGRTQRGEGRIRAGLPSSAFLAHRPGTSGVDQGLSTAHNDVGIFTLADKRSYALAIFLSGSTQGEAARDRILADVTREAVRAVA
ncbi:MAG: class A beta-lactamase [Phenylobacterium sp.]|nr:class A beta-lactamase [Phenylobacterium sp.]